MLANPTAPQSELEPLPLCLCKACGETSTMRIDENSHPIDECPHCKTTGFMNLAESEQSEHPAPEYREIEPLQMLKRLSLEDQVDIGAMIAAGDWNGVERILRPRSTQQTTGEGEV